VAVVVLTDRCTLSCDVCFRPARAARGNAAWSFAELETCLAELAALGQRVVAFTGGEPSLWKDGKVEFGHLLAATARAGLCPMFVTNGWPFRTYDLGSALLDRYFDANDAPLTVIVSVDYWHNGTWVEGRSPALETLLQWLSTRARPRSLDIEVASLWCLDDRHNIPLEHFARYTEAGMRVGYLPLSPIGRAQEFAGLAPTLCPAGACKSSLGSYGEVLRSKMGLPEEAWAMLDNSALFGPCLAVETLTLDLDHHYWLCNDRSGDSLRVASAGKLTAASIAGCLARNPLVALFRERGLVDVLRRCMRGAGIVAPQVVEDILTQTHPYGISGRASCGLCSSLSRELLS
jgi:hypothetical protein